MMSDDIKKAFVESTPKRKIRIVWVELTPESQKLVRESVKDKWFFPNCNLLKEQSCHHVTLWYNPTDAELKTMQNWANPGDLIDLETSKLCHNNEIQALVVNDIRSQDVQMAIPNKIPHITICANVGVMPSKSNDMLKDPQHCYSLRLKLQGVLRYIYAK